MRFADYAKKILGLAKTIYLWLGFLADLDPDKRVRIAKYADAIADTLGRATEALIVLSEDPGNRTARTGAVRELGRIGGYIETIVAVLEHQLDGRKLAGVKRRLERITAPAKRSVGRDVAAQQARLDRLAEAEGYFRALADGLRT